MEIKEWEKNQGAIRTCKQNCLNVLFAHWIIWGHMVTVNVSACVCTSICT